VNSFINRLREKGRVHPEDVEFILADSTSHRVARVHRIADGSSFGDDVATEAALHPKQWGAIQVDSSSPADLPRP